MCNDQLIIAYTFLMLLGAPQMHNEYFYHNEPHNDAPSVSVQGSGISTLLRTVWAMLEMYRALPTSLIPHVLHTYC